MALQDYKDDMQTCCRCSICKFVPLETVKGYDHVTFVPLSRGTTTAPTRAGAC